MELKIEQVAVLLDTSTKTINNWYAFKRQHPEHELAQLLPEFIQSGERKTRYWKASDLAMLKEFKDKVPKGRNGLMGCVTQKYYHNKKEEK